MIRFILASAVAFALSGPVGTSQTAASNVVVITIDGYRWQELFTGVTSEYFTKDSKGQPGAMEQRIWRATPDARRRALTPCCSSRPTMVAGRRRWTGSGEDFRAVVPLAAAPLPLGRR